MNLRVRITLIVSVCFLAFVALLLLDGRTREAAVGARLEATVADGLRTTWFGLIGAERQRLLRHIEQIQREGKATAAFVAGNAEQFAQATLKTRAQLRASLRTTEMQAIHASGTPFFDTRTESIQTTGASVLRPSAIQRIINQPEPVDGVFRSTEGTLVYAFVAPIFGRAGVAGLLVLHTQLADLVAELADLTGARTLIKGPGGELLGATKAWDRALLDDVKLPNGRAEPSDYVATRKANGRAIQVAFLPLRGPAADDIGAIAALRDVSNEIQKRELISRLSYFALGCTLVLFLAFVNWYLRFSFRPLNGVIRSLKALSAGRTDISVTVPARDDEIGRLAGTFESFRKGMEARSQLQRLHQELEVAARIQRQCLPGKFPEHDAVAFAAEMTPARDVGGDFYDVFDLPDGRIGCVIADVSDKGMGAALFMAASRTVIRSTAVLTRDPAECLRRANDYLAEDNTAMMFVTAFYAILNPRTGEVEFCNAGHNPPVQRGPDGHAELISAAAQPALGVMEGFDYESDRLVLPPGSQLFLYTDGVSEAMSPDGETFDEDRLLYALANEPGDTTAQRLVERVLSDVLTFVDGADQSDDITCLAVALQKAPA